MVFAIAGRAGDGHNLDVFLDAFPETQLASLDGPHRITPAEQFAGGRPLQLSLVENGTVLAQPRLVANGDVKGGRYVSGIVDIYVGSGPAR